MNAPDTNSLNFAIWVALFAAFATLFGTVVNAIVQYKITKSNNDYILKKTKLEYEINSKYKFNDELINKIQNAVISLNNNLILLSKGTFESNQNFWSSYYTAYYLASVETRIKLENLKEYIKNRTIDLNTIKNDHNFDSIISEVNQSFFNDILSLKNQSNNK